MEDNKRIVFKVKNTLVIKLKEEILALKIGEEVERDAFIRKIYSLSQEQKVDYFLSRSFDSLKTQVCNQEGLKFISQKRKHLTRLK